LCRRECSAIVGRQHGFVADRLRAPR
jgi:hypothetical protein